MLSIPGKQSRLCDGLSRREFIRVGGSAMLGISLPQILALEAKASNNIDLTKTGNGFGRAKSVILIFL